MDWRNITLIGLLAGTLGTGLGGLLGFFFRRPSNKALGAALGASAGVMLSIIFMELMEEALGEGLLYAALGFLLGVLIFIILDNRFPHHHFVSEETHSGAFVKKGYLIATGIALHNLPEGIAIGAGFASSNVLGAALAVLIGLHNIPEGLAVAIPLNAGGNRPLRSFAVTLLAGLPMGAGALIGSLIGSVSPLFLAIALGFAAGAMFYIVCDELIPDVYQLTSPHAAIWGITGGALLGVAMIYFLAI